MHTFSKVIHTLCKSEAVFIVQKAFYAAEAIGVEHIGHALGLGLHAGIEPVINDGRYRRYQKSLQALGQLIAHLAQNKYLLLEIRVCMPRDDLEHRIMVAVGAGKDAAELLIFLQKPQCLKRVEAL